MGNYSIRADETLKMVQVSVNGEVDINFIKKWVRESRNLAAKLKYGIILDLQESIFDHDYGTAYFFPRDKETFTDEVRDVKVAILTPRDGDEKFWKFYEVTARNAGLKIAVFQTREQAYKWMGIA